jgi:drug/metabolite transporter (DMT)-like permease
VLLEFDPLTKIGLGSIPPITFISARSLIAAGFLLVVLRVRGIPMPERRPQHWCNFQIIAGGNLRRNSKEL